MARCCQPVPASAHHSVCLAVWVWIVFLSPGVSFLALYQCARWCFHTFVIISAAPHPHVAIFRFVSLHPGRIRCGTLHGSTWATRMTTRIRGRRCLAARCQRPFQGLCSWTRLAVVCTCRQRHRRIDGPRRRRSRSTGSCSVFGMRDGTRSRGSAKVCSERCVSCHRFSRQLSFFSFKQMTPIPPSPTTAHSTPSPPLEIEVGL